MRIAFALLLLVFVAGCAGVQQPLAPVQETQKTAQQQVTPQATQVPLDVKIYFVNLPTSIKANSKSVVKWKIESNLQKNISHTAMHYGSKSVPEELSTDVAPANSGYPSFTPKYASDVNKIPNEFNTVVVLENKGTIYARAHVIVDGKNYWSDEKSIQVE